MIFKVFYLKIFSKKGEIYYNSYKKYVNKTFSLKIENISWNYNGIFFKFAYTWARKPFDTLSVLRQRTERTVISLDRSTGLPVWIFRSNGQV